MKNILAEKIFALEEMLTGRAKYRARIRAILGGVELYHEKCDQISGIGNHKTSKAGRQDT